jgi:uncharacterized membrane protein
MKKLLRGGNRSMAESAEAGMQHYFWNDWYIGGGWLFWLGVICLLLSSMGSRRYTYAARRKCRLPLQKGPLDMLHERYARGEINREQFARMRSALSKTR